MVNEIISTLTIISILIGILMKCVKIKQRVVTIHHKTTLNVNKAGFGEFEFDYSNNNGVFIIGEGEYQFDTRWSKASNTSIHAYKYPQNIHSIALIKENVDLQNVKSVEGLDISSDCRVARIGQSIIWKNIYGHYAITKISQIKDDTRGDDCDLLKCEYIILK